MLVRAKVRMIRWGRVGPLGSPSGRTGCPWRAAWTSRGRTSGRAAWPEGLPRSVPALRGNRCDGQAVGQSEAWRRALQTMRC